MDQDLDRQTYRTKEGGYLLPADNSPSYGNPRPTKALDCSNNLHMGMNMYEVAIQ